MLQYDVRRRISADESLKSHYFDSLGPGVQSLSDSIHFNSDITYMLVLVKCVSGMKLSG